MKSLILALIAVVAFAASAEAGGVVVRRGIFGRTVVVQRGPVVVDRGFSRGVVVDPHFRSFHGQPRVVFDRFGRAIIVR